METLASRVARDGPLTARDAVGWTVRLCKSVEAIHALGVAHGSLSAEVVLVEGSRCDSRGLLADARRARDLPGYHSPERADGAGITPADDTWGVAVTLYLALTGSLPFPGETGAEVKERILAAQPSPLAVFDAGDEGLQKIVDAAFARDMGRRTTALSRLRQALELWARDPEVRNLRALDEDEDDEPTSPGVAKQAAVAELMEDDEGATNVRPLGAIQAHLARTSARPPAAAPVGGRAARPAPAAPRAAPAGAPAQAPRIQGATAPMPAGKPPPPPPRPAAAPRTPPPPRPPSPSAATIALPPVLGPPPILDEESADEVATSVMESPFAASQAPFPREGPTKVGLGGTRLMPPMADRLAARAELQPAPPPPAQPEAPAAGMAPYATGGPPPQPMQPPMHPPPPHGMAPDSQQAPWGAAGAGMQQAPASRAAKPARAARSGMLLAVGAATLFVVGGAGAVLLMRPRLLSGGPRPVAPASAAASAAVEAAPPPASAPGSAAPASLPGASAAAPASGPAPEASAPPSAPALEPPANVTACLVPLFPPGTFDPDDKPALDFVCTEANPRTGSTAVKAEVVRAGGAGSARGVSQGMQEWAVLGWYEMAAYAVIRARCCPGAPALAAPPTPACELDAALAELGAAAVTPGDGASASAAVLGYTRAAQCTVRGGAAKRYGRADRIEGGEATTFQKTLDRVRATLE